MNFSNNKTIRLETSKGNMEKAIMDGIRECIKVHGDVTPAFINSCAKRIIGQLKPYVVDVEQICICGETMELDQVDKNYVFKNRHITVKHIPILTCNCGNTKIPAYVKQTVGTILQDSDPKKSILQYSVSTNK